MGRRFRKGHYCREKKEEVKEKKVKRELEYRTEREKNGGEGTGQ